MKPVDVAIIIVTYNKLHPQCLASVQRLMDATTLSVACVVVDNASPSLDVAAEVRRALRGAHVVIGERNVGFGRACNRGARVVSAKRYFFLNPDTHITDEQLLDTLHTFCEMHPRVGIVAPKISYLDGTLQDTCRRFPKWHTPVMRRTQMLPARRQAHDDWFLMRTFDHASSQMVDWVQGSAFMIDAELFHEIGGFDERYFMYYEDVDLCRSCWDRGRPVYYLPEAHVYHEHGKGSANQGGALTSLLRNKMARVHVGSWLKYTKKWAGHTL